MSPDPTPVMPDPQPPGPVQPAPPWVYVVYVQVSAEGGVRIVDVFASETSALACRDANAGSEIQVWAPRP